MVLSYLPMVVVATQVVACRLQAGPDALSLLYTARARGAWLDPHYMARERSICTLCPTSCTTVWVCMHTVERYIAMYVVATYSAMCTAHLYTGVHAHSSAARRCTESTIWGTICTHMVPAGYHGVVHLSAPTTLYAIMHTVVLTTPPYGHPMGST